MSGINLIKTNIDEVKIFKDDVITIVGVVFPCTLLSNEVEFVVENPNILRVASNCIGAITVHGLNGGKTIIKAYSKEDHSISKIIKCEVQETPSIPLVDKIYYNDKKAKITFKNYPKYSEIIVNKTWTKDEIDLDVKQKFIEVELDKKNYDYYVKIAFKLDDNIGPWQTVRLRAEEEKVISKMVFKNLAVRDSFSNKYSLSMNVESVAKVEINQLWDNQRLTFDLNNLDSKVATLSSNSDETLKTLSIKITTPDKDKAYYLKIRATDYEGKQTAWFIVKIFDKLSKKLTVSPNGYQDKLKYNLFFSLIGCLASSPEGSEKSNIKVELYDSVEGSLVNYLTTNEVFTSKVTNGDKCSAGYGALKDEGETEDGGDNWVSIQKQGKTYYTKQYGSDLEPNYQCLLSLAYRNCLGSSKFIPGVFPGEEDYRMVVGQTVERKNCALAVIKLSQPEILAGFKLLKSVPLYDKDGNNIKELSAGNWIWISNNYVDSSEPIVGGAITNEGRLIINSYSSSVDINEIMANANKVNVFNLDVLGLYSIDAYLLGNKDGYAIDTTLYSDLAATTNNYISNGYFDYANEGDNVLLWSGSTYSIRSDTCNKTISKDSNVIAHMHQGYLVSTCTGTDIKNAKVATTCTYENAKKNAFEKVFGSIFMPDTKKLMDLHDIQDFYYIRGFFDIQEDKEGYFIGNQIISLCSKEWRHEQNSDHVAINIGGTQKVQTVEKFPDEYVAVTDSIFKEAMVDENGEVIADKDNENKGMTGYTSNVLSSFFPFSIYVMKRLETKCAEETGEPLDTLTNLCNSYKSNFAIFNDPINGYEINFNKMTEPLLGVKVTKDNINLYRENSSTDKTFIKCLDQTGEEIVLNIGDWIWFNDSLAPKFYDKDRHYISIMGFSFGTDSDGNPVGPIKLDGAYIDAGLTNVSEDDQTGTLETIKDRLKKVIDKDYIPSCNSDCRKYNIATMANPNGIEPHLLNEDERYNKMIENSLCYNNNLNINVMCDDGQEDVIKIGRLFVFLSEYESNRTKYSRVYFYSDKDRQYKFGSIQVPGAVIYNYDIRNIDVNDHDIDGKAYGILPVLCQTNIYTSYGEYFCTTRESDVVLFDKNINITTKYGKLSIKNIPNYIKNGEVNKVESYKDFEKINKGTVEKTRPTWFRCQYFGYKRKDETIGFEKINGYVKLDLSKDYTGKLV